MYRRALEDENQCPNHMAENAGDEDSPDDLFVCLVGLAQDAKVRKAEGNFEAQNTCHVERATGKVDLSIAC